MLLDIERLSINDLKKLFRLVMQSEDTLSVGEMRQSFIDSLPDYKKEEPKDYIPLICRICKQVIIPQLFNEDHKECIPIAHATVQYIS